jgi:hypothetical protein
VRLAQGWGFFIAPDRFHRREILSKEGPVMTPNPGQVIVTSDDLSRACVHGFAARHRSFPEVHGMGNSAKGAAAHLKGLLHQTLDNAPADWHRELILDALEDVRAFAEFDDE